MCLTDCMKERNIDILAECQELKKMPYSVPDGYFEKFKEQIKPYEQTGRHLFAARLMPYAAMAAMFVFLVTAGTFFLRKSTPADEFTQEDYILFSDNLTNAIYYENTYHYADAEIEDEDIIEYLIYCGTSAEELELLK